MKKLVKHFTLGLAAILSGFGFVFATYDHFTQAQPDYRHMTEPPASTATGTIEPTRYVVNLLSRTEPIAMATVQHPDALAAYQVYSTQLVINDTVWHQLRLGFFSDAESARTVAEGLIADYPLARVAPISQKEWLARASAAFVVLASADAAVQDKARDARAGAAQTKVNRSPAPGPRTVRVALSKQIATTNSDSAVADDNPTDCDSLTAHPWDPEKLTDGIYWNKLPAGRAVSACRSAVRANPNPRNMFQYARALAKSKEFHEAVGWYKKSAYQGYVQAQYALGDVYEFGEGVQIDYLEAQAWYRKAAAQGYTHATDRLSRLRDATNVNAQRQTAGVAAPTVSVN